VSGQRTPPPPSSPLVSDPGPAPRLRAVDPAAGGPEPLEAPAAYSDPVDAGDLELLGWDEARVRALLVPMGFGLHYVGGAGHPEAFKMTDDDLEAIAPPLTRILNRYPVTRAAAAGGDELALAVGVGMYGLRSIRQRGQIIAQRELEAEQLAGEQAARERQTYAAAAPPTPGGPL
jgi:hypothetical protein